MFNLPPENIAFGFVGLLISIIILLAITKRSRRYPYFAQEFLLTKAEQKFYNVLKAVVKNKYEIACKVRLADIINCSDLNWRKGYGGQIACKHIDFVLFDPRTSKILLAIELDDKSHDKPARQKRDKFVNKAMQVAGVTLLRIPVTWGYDMGKLDQEIKVALSHG